MSDRYQRLGRPVIFRPLEHGVHIGLLLTSDAFRNNRSQGLIIAVDPRWQPERDATAVPGALSSACFKRA